MVAPEFWYSSARQGGFSSVVLPAAGVCGGSSGLVIWCDGTTTPQLSDGLSASIVEGGPAVAYSSGGPFNEPYFGVGGGDFGTTFEISGAALDMSGDFWIEQYHRGSAFDASPTCASIIVSGNGRIEILAILGDDSPFPPLALIGAFNPSFSSSLQLTGSSALSSWNYVLLAKTGDTIYGWINGSPISTVYTSGDPSPLDCTGGTLRVHTRIELGQTRFNVGTCPYTEGETIPVPTEPFMAV